MKVKLGSTTRLQNSSSIHNKMSGGAMSGFGRFSNGRAALLALASTGLVGIAVPALGQDATWLANPGTADYNTAANWAPGDGASRHRIVWQLEHDGADALGRHHGRRLDLQSRRLELCSRQPQLPSNSHFQRCRH
ncbi:hypothetical protein [Bradyrhizobium sp. CAR08]